MRPQSNNPQDGPEATTDVVENARGKVAINAPFFDEIKTDSVRLRQLLSELADRLGSSFDSPHAIVRLVGLVRRLRAQLAFHFSLEEVYGYFHEPLEAAPQLCSLAVLLRGQHDSLRRQIEYLASEGDELNRTAAEPGFCRGVRAQRFISLVCDFYRQLLEHEQNEGELILQALNDDFGVGD